MKYLFRILVPVFIFPFFLQVLPATGGARAPWGGKLADGTVITEEDLAEILTKHNKWITTKGKEGRQAPLWGANLTEAPLWRANLTEAYLQGADLTRANLQGANLTKAFLWEANLTKANLQGADLTEAPLWEANLTEADLQGADLTRANLQGANLTKAKLRRTNLAEGKLQEADLAEADLQEANLTKANLQRADLTRANLQGADLAEGKLQGADLAEADLQEANLTKANLQRADLTRANLQGADLTEAPLWEANLTEADLQGADLNKADLRKANLTEAILWLVNLTKADLTDANLTNADLNMADLTEAILQGANLTKAILVGTNLINADLWGAYLSKALYEPKLDSVPYIPAMIAAFNLSTLTFSESPHGLVELREEFKKAGLSEQERKITYAIEHTKRVKLTTYTSIVDPIITLGQFITAMGIEFLGWIKYFFIELTCLYGMTPWRPLLLLIFVSIPVFTIPYVFFLRKESKDGIWKVWNEKRMRDDLGETKPKEPLVLQGWTATRVAFYFSILSAFSIGWRELNVGNWIARIQRYEFNYRATGWVRTVSGIQSLLSVYLLALWALTYFSRPFA